VSLYRFRKKVSAPETVTLKTLDLVKSCVVALDRARSSKFDVENSASSRPSQKYGALVDATGLEVVETSKVVLDSITPRLSPLTTTFASTTNVINIQTRENQKHGNDVYFSLCTRRRRSPIRL
jgi:hypothetical protein